MVYVMLRTNQTFTDGFFPFFEVVYTLELRLHMCSLVLQGIMGTSARRILLYNQCAGSGPLEERPVVILASIFRCSMMETFCSVFFFFAVERSIATFAWSWYEKESMWTLIVASVLEVCSLLYSWSWSLALIFERINPKILIIGMSGSVVVGVVACLFIVNVNYRAWKKLKAGARINRYSVARTFQIRENIALIRIGKRIMLLNIPVIILGLCQHFLSGENPIAKRLIVRAFFDLAISIYPPFIITYIPFSDIIFEKSLKRMIHGDRLFRVFSILHKWSRRKRHGKVAMNETDYYFIMLSKSLDGPPQKLPEPSCGSLSCKRTKAS